MKSRLLLLTTLLFYFANHSYACPIWPVGKLYVVDANNKIIADAKVWQYYSFVDSFLKEKEDDYEEFEDTNSYVFWRGGWGWDSDEETEKYTGKYLLIQAKGYADVIINSIDFKRSENGLPVVYIHMYPKSYLVKGELVTLIDKNVVETLLEAKDTVHVTETFYNESLKKENTVEEAARIAAFSIKAFPNPVIDKLNVFVNQDLTMSYKAILTDITGKSIREIEICQRNTVLDLQWELPGMYVIKVLNSDGEMLYALKFMKT